MALKAGVVRSNWASLPLELAVGVIFFAHGLQKFLDPAGFGDRTLSRLGIPFFMAYVVTAAEFGGGLLLLSGLLVRLAALGHLCVMAVAITQVHWPVGLTAQGGYEFPLSLFAASIALLILGGDPLSVDDNAGISIHRSREAALRRDSIDVGGQVVKIAGALLIVCGIVLPAARLYLGVPEGTGPLAVTAAAGIISVLAGAMIIAGKPWAYIPAFVVARLYLGASALMLFYVKYAWRGIAALLVSLIILAALRSARRARGER